VSSRSRKEQVTYERHLKKSDRTVCAFCLINKKSPQFIEDTEHFKVIRNIFAYSIWDGQYVADHLMIVPKVHTDTLANMSASQKIEYFDLLEKYEGLHYSIYARAPSSVMKSIVHQHTHLIKPGGKLKRFILLTFKPYFRLAR